MFQKQALVRLGPPARCPSICFKPEIIRMFTNRWMTKHYYLADNLLKRVATISMIWGFSVGFESQACLQLDQGLIYHGLAPLSERTKGRLPSEWEEVDIQSLGKSKYGNEAVVRVSGSRAETNRILKWLKAEWRPVGHYYYCSVGSMDVM